ncbi:MAG TPA: TMEM175 family protein [Dehalococcoidia bacterium]|nr:TMEM175 family protein [Dehalococcoidia bacterium]
MSASEREPAATPAAPSPAALPSDNTRLLQLSDGVFAVAMTLLVFGLTPPDPRSTPPDRLVQAVRDQWPHFLSYTLSFVVIGSLWITHHRIFRYLKSHDGPLIWLNLLVLLCVALLPYPTEVMGEYGSRSFPVGLYAASMGVTSLSLNLLWFYARHDPRLVNEDLPVSARRFYPWRGLVTTVVFFASAPLAAIDPAMAQRSWALIALAIPIIYRLTRETE